MRISKLYLPAVAMVGALALAGCGGGSDNMDMGGGNGGGGNGGGADFSVADVPDGATGSITYSPDSRQVYRVSPDTHTKFGLGSTNVSVYCPPAATEGCRYRVTENNDVEVTNGASLVLDSSIRVATGGVSTPPSADTDPLSADTLAEALKTTGSGGTMWSATGASLDANTVGMPHARVTVDGERLELSLAKAGDADAAYWGHWRRYKPAATEFGKPTGESRRTFFGGATRYETKPDDGLDNAAYNGTGVRFYYKHGTGEWEDGSAAATLNLRANFEAGKISGQITGVAAGIGDLTGNAADIDLNETDISGSGTFRGSAAFSDDDATRNGGSWNGAFYGSVTDSPTDDTPQVYVQPAHAAGEFSVAGRLGNTPATDLRVNGAFGAALDGS